MDITKLSTAELKALAYDQLVLLQQTQNNIRVLEEEIQKRAKAQAEAKEPVL